MCGRESQRICAQRQLHSVSPASSSGGVRRRAAFLPHPADSSCYRTSSWAAIVGRAATVGSGLLRHRQFRQVEELHLHESPALPCRIWREPLYSPVRVAASKSPKRCMRVAARLGVARPANASLSWPSSRSSTSCGFSWYKRIRARRSTPDVLEARCRAYQAVHAASRRHPGRGCCPYTGAPSRDATALHTPYSRSCSPAGPLPTPRPRDRLRSHGPPGSSNRAECLATWASSLLLLYKLKPMMRPTAITTPAMT